jgi:ABC-type uncharacterized transport system substrate-binding protein
VTLATRKDETSSSNRVSQMATITNCQCLRANWHVSVGEPVLLAAKEKGENIPIVVVSCDPLEKLLGSLRRPGGNATGFTCVSSDLIGKRFSLLKGLLPRIGRVALLYNKRDNHELEFKDAEASGQSLEIGLMRFPVESPADFEPTFKRMIEQRCDAVYVTSTPFSVGRSLLRSRSVTDYRHCTASGSSRRLAG